MKREGQRFPGDATVDVYRWDAPQLVLPNQRRRFFEALDHVDWNCRPPSIVRASVEQLDPRGIENERSCTSRRKPFALSIELSRKLMELHRQSRIIRDLSDVRLGIGPTQRGGSASGSKFPDRQNRAQE